MISAELFCEAQQCAAQSVLYKAFLTDDAGSILVLVEEGEVFNSFVHEGAG